MTVNTSLGTLCGYRSFRIEDIYVPLAVPSVRWCVQNVNLGTSRRLSGCTPHPLILFPITGTVLEHLPCYPILGAWLHFNICIKNTCPGFAPIVYSKTEFRMRFQRKWGSHHGPWMYTHL